MNLRRDSLDVRAHALTLRHRWLTQRLDALSAPHVLAEHPDLDRARSVLLMGAATRLAVMVPDGVVVDLFPDDPTALDVKAAELDLMAGAIDTLADTCDLLAYAIHGGQADGIDARTEEWLTHHLNLTTTTEDTTR